MARLFLTLTLKCCLLCFLRVFVHKLYLLRCVALRCAAQRSAAHTWLLSACSLRRAATDFRKLENADYLPEKSDFCSFILFSFTMVTLTAVGSHENFDTLGKSEKSSSAQQGRLYAGTINAASELIKRSRKRTSARQSGLSACFSRQYIGLTGLKARFVKVISRNESTTFVPAHFLLLRLCFSLLVCFDCAHVCRCFLLSPVFLLSFPTAFCVLRSAQCSVQSKAKQSEAVLQKSAS